MATTSVERQAPGAEEASTSTAIHDGYTFTVGKLDAGMAILIGDRASLIEFPSLLLPPGVKHGSVVDIRVLRNEDEERRQQDEFNELQELIYNEYGVATPSAPVLKLRNTTQTTVTLEWEPLQIANADLHSLEIMRNGVRITRVPNPLKKTTLKLSGLVMDQEYSFQLVLNTSAGTYTSKVVKTRTHTINDLSGVRACFAGVTNECLLDAAKGIVDAFGAKYTDSIEIDTTHVIMSAEPPADTQDPTIRAWRQLFEKAQELNIPVVQPHWLFACEEQRRMAGISGYYLDQAPENSARINERLNPPPAPPAKESKPEPAGGKEQGAAEAPVEANVHEVSARETREEPQEPVQKEPEEMEKPAGEPTTAAPTEKPTDEPVDEPRKQAEEQKEPAENPTEKPAEEPTEKPAEEPTEKLAEEPTEKPVEEPTEKPAEVSTEEPAEEPTEKPPAESTPEPHAAPAPPDAENVWAKPAEAADASVGDIEASLDDIDLNEPTGN